ncbi:MAG: translation initiation factor IF-2 subunit beta, partial [Candidatus Aenigmarchaeota archaeon]|nr:translation initiation factor IF-2 subunit beta [Candidatus Aenigmarchaeota archaeon]
YEKLLDQAFGKLPEKSESGERFQMPKASVLPAGARTIITNFVEIANSLRRKPDHLQKFLLKELATSGSGELKGNRLIVQGRFRSDVVDKKIELYMKEYVLCPDCGKPDTKFMKEDRYLFLKCEACGSKHVVKKV